MGTSPLQRKIALESGGSHGATTLSELRRFKFVETLVPRASRQAVATTPLHLTAPKDPAPRLWRLGLSSACICEICGWLGLVSFGCGLAALGESVKSVDCISARLRECPGRRESDAGAGAGYEGDLGLKIINRIHLLVCFPPCSWSDLRDAVGDLHSASLCPLHALSVSNRPDIKLFGQRSASAFHSYVHRAL